MFTLQHVKHKLMHLIIILNYNWFNIFRYLQKFCNFEIFVSNICNSPNIKAVWVETNSEHQLMLNSCCVCSALSIFKGCISHNIP